MAHRLLYGTIHSKHIPPAPTMIMQPIAKCLNYIICGGIIVHSTTCQYFPRGDADIWYLWLSNQHIPRVPIFVGEPHRHLSKNHINDYNCFFTFALVHMFTAGIYLCSPRLTNSTTSPKLNVFKFMFYNSSSIYSVAFCLSAAQYVHRVDFYCYYPWSTLRSGLNLCEKSVRNIAISWFPNLD